MAGNKSQPAPDLEKMDLIRMFTFDVLPGRKIPQETRDELAKLKPLFEKEWEKSADKHGKFEMMVLERTDGGKVEEWEKESPVGRLAEEAQKEKARAEIFANAARAADQESLPKYLVVSLEEAILILVAERENKRR